jgi:hypothetical protein
MIAWWIGDVVLLVVVLPVVVYLLRGVLEAANAITSSVAKIAHAARAGSKDLDAVQLLVRTREQTVETVQVVAGYGGSLDQIIDDA